MTNEALMAEASPMIAKLGAAFYFTPATLAKGTELGLDFAQFYVMGRGGVLGDVEPTTVLSAFGYFKPAMVDATWNAGKAVMAPRDAARAHFACAAEHGRDATHAAMDEAEALTDRMVAPAYAALDDVGGAALLDGLTAMQAAHA